jgi:N-acetyl-anhydromuramyl-L-alanine amidase AmpD
MPSSSRPTENDPALLKQDRRQEFLYLLMCAAVAMLALVLLLIVYVTRRPSPPPARPSAPYVGESIVVAGQSFEIGTPVALWSHEKGYNAYRTDYFFEESREHPNRLEGGEDRRRVNQRGALLTAGDELSDEEVLARLRDSVDLFVMHYDVCGVSRQCFKILHDIRGLSVHFMLDVDGTIYQTVDLKEQTWHASHMNGRSIGIEIANPGAYAGLDKLNEWYLENEAGSPVLTLPDWITDDGILTPDFVTRPSRRGPITGYIHGRRLVQYDFTDAQYDALIHLVAGVNRVLPQIAIDAPRDAEGNVRTDLLSRQEQQAFQGLIGHWHFEKQKTDPGPAFDWERVIEGARALRASE